MVKEFIRSWIFSWVWLQIPIRSYPGWKRLLLKTKQNNHKNKVKYFVLFFFGPQPFHLKTVICWYSPLIGHNSVGTVPWLAHCNSVGGFAYLLSWICLSQALLSSLGFFSWGPHTAIQKLRAPARPAPPRPFQTLAAPRLLSWHWLFASQLPVGSGEAWEHRVQPALGSGSSDSSPAL